MKKDMELDRSNIKKILDISIDLLNKKQVISILKDKLIQDNDGVFCVSTLNIELIMKAQEFSEFKNYLNNTSNLNVIDGVGILNVLKWYGMSGFERVCGSDLIYDIADMCSLNNKKIFILGAEENISNKAKEKLKNTYKNLKIDNYSPAFTKNLKFTDAENEIIMTKITEFKPDVVCVAFGAPKQELWIKDNLTFLKENNIKIAIGLGGTFDFVAGKVNRAPEIFKKTGNEWLYRLMQEPKSRFKRQITTIPIYYLYCFIEFLRNK